MTEARNERQDGLKRWWISWFQPTEDSRPLTYPPNERILGWWETGFEIDGPFTLVALVLGSTAEDAKSAVRQDWPEAERWRFCNQRSEQYRPSDRFPISDWMRARIDGGVAA